MKKIDICVQIFPKLRKKHEHVKVRLISRHKKELSIKLYKMSHNVTLNNT